MNTEITKQKDDQGPRGWIVYDAECGFCVSVRNAIGPVFEKRNYGWLPSRSPQATAMLGSHDLRGIDQMLLRLSDGTISGGVDAWIVLCRSVWWLRLCGWLMSLPGLNGITKACYRWIARNRYCFGGRCRVTPGRNADFQIGSNATRSTRSRCENQCSFNWLPLVLLPLAVMFLRGAVVPWVFMWLLAFALYFGCKWLTYRDALAGGVRASWLTRMTYLLLWPGMSLKEFAGVPPATSRTIALPRWLAPVAKTFAGAGLVWFAVPAIAHDAWLLRGWVGMIGLIMMLHFGTFHLLALTLQAAKFNAQPNMRAPLLAKSLADFWGRRWNTAFNVLADRYGFRPLTPRIGPRAALVVVFLASGLIHDLVIALPAGGGFGLPTLYFVLQAIGLFVERLPSIRRRPLVNRLFTWLVLIAPLGCLFPPVFVRNVILPMLNAIGAN